MTAPEPEYRIGVCPIGREKIMPLGKFSWTDQVREPYLVCPLHNCVVPLGVIPEEEFLALKPTAKTEDQLRGGENRQ